MSGTTPLPMPLEPTPPVHIISPAAPAHPAHQLQEPVSPPPALASPQVTSQPAQVEGVVSERQHQPPPQPAIEPSAPPSVDPTQTLLPHDQLPGGMTPPNPVSPQEQPPSRGRESDPERVQPNGTASSQVPIDPSMHYLPEEPLPSADPLHVPKTGVLRVLAATPSLRCFVCQRLIR